MMACTHLCIEWPVSVQFTRNFGDGILRSSKENIEHIITGQSPDHQPVWWDERGYWTLLVACVWKLGTRKKIRSFIGKMTLNQWIVWGTPFSEKPEWVEGTWVWVKSWREPMHLPLDFISFGQFVSCFHLFRPIPKWILLNRYQFYRAQRHVFVFIVVYNLNICNPSWSNWSLWSKAAIAAIAANIINLVSVFDHRAELPVPNGPVRGDHGVTTTSARRADSQSTCRALAPGEDP